MTDPDRRRGETTVDGVELRMGRRELIGFLALVSMMSAVAVDAFLPGFSAMRESFGLPPDSSDLGRTISLFFLGTALGMPIYGPLTDALGRKRVLNLSLALYVASALVAAFAPSLTVLYASRMLWGFSAAGPRVVSQAVIRDRYSGNEMAKMMSLIQTVFFAGPVFSPLLGQAILQFATWRWLMALIATVALLVMVWGARMVETLTPENRTPFEPRAVVRSAGIVVRNRITIRHAIGMTFFGGAFFAFLGSIELIMSDVYDRPDWFLPLFVASALVQAAVALTVSRVVMRLGARRIVSTAAIGYASSTVALFAVAIASDWLPSLWTFLVIILLINGFFVMLFPSSMSLALEPMGQRAGMAAAVIGSIRTAGGAVLAGFINEGVDGTLRSVAIGYVIYGVLGLGFILSAVRRTEPASDEFGSPVVPAR